MTPPPRWPAAALAGLAAGIAACPLPDVRVLVLALLLPAGAALLARGHVRTLLLLAAIFAAVGYLRTDLEYRLLQVDPLAGQDRRTLHVRGTVLEAPRQRSWGSAFRFRLDDVQELPDVRGATILVELRGDSVAAAGERWAFTGRLKPLPDARYPKGFDMGAWLQRQGVHHRLSAQESERLGPPQGWAPVALAWRVRLWLADGLHGRLTPNAEALTVGIMLGESRGLPPELQESFRRAGVSHLLAASGLNVAIVTGLVFLVARRLGFGRKPAAVPALAAAAGYALLAGGSPSITRAAVMAAVALLALTLGRRSDALHALLLGALAVLVMRPLWLHDVGFQLSLAAVAGLLAFYTPLEDRLAPLAKPLRVSLAATVAASLPLLPLLAWHFQEISAVSVLANLVMAPAAEALLPLGLGTAVLVHLSPLLAALPLALCTALGEYLAGAATLLGGLADPVHVPRPDAPALAACLLALAAARLQLRREGTPRLRAGLALGALLLLTASCVPELPTDRLTARVVDLPGGAAVWVTTPRNRQLLLLQDQESLTFAEEMLAVHGLARATAVYAPGEPGTDSPEGGVQVTTTPTHVRLAWGGFSVLQGEPEAPGTIAVLPRKAKPRAVLPLVQPQLTVWIGGPPRKEWRNAGPEWWSTDEHGPLQVETDGTVVHWRRWAD